MNTFIKQTGSCYIITNFDYIWDISQLYPVYSDNIIVITPDLSSPWSHVITTISSLYWDITNTYNVCMYVRMYVFVYVYMYVSMYVLKYLRMYVCMYVCTYICTYMHVCTHAHVHI